MKNAVIYYVITTLVCTLLAITTGENKSQPQFPGNTVEKAVEPRTTVSGPQAWALACAAVLTERNHDNHELLGTELRDEGSTIHYQYLLLTSGFGVSSRTDLLNTLMWIESGGHRLEFEEWGKKVEGLSNEQYEKLLIDYESDSELVYRIKIAAKYYKLLGEKSLLGWDYSRYINLCRWGYMADYLSEAEAWEKIMSTARLLQERFDSWEDLGQNYLIGRKFWSKEESEENGYQYEDAYLRLVDMPSSPWNKLVWDLDLKVEAPSDKPQKTIEIRNDYTI